MPVINPIETVPVITTPIVTGKIDNSKTYSGNDCIMVGGKLYWEESIGNFLPEDFEKNYVLIGTISKLVDKIPEEDMTSAKTREGSKVYQNKNYPSSIFVLWENEQKEPVLIKFVESPYLR